MNRFLEKLTETCWFNEPTMLAIVQPMEMKDYIVIAKEGNIVFGPNTFGICAMFIKDKAKEQGIYYSIDDAKEAMNVQG